MLCTNNELAISQWTARNYGEAYRSYINDFGVLENWFSSFMPEQESFEVIYAFYMLCFSFHELGF